MADVVDRGWGGDIIGQCGTSLLGGDVKIRKDHSDIDKRIIV
jgi:hypothetical protein